MNDHHAVKPKAEPIRPTVNDVNRPFWDGCGRGELMAQRCRSCAHLRYPAAIVCPDCLSAEAEWQPVSGRGRCSRSSSSIAPITRPGRARCRTPWR